VATQFTRHSEEARRLFCEHYLHEVTELNDLYESRDSPDAQLSDVIDRFSEDWPQISHAQAWASKNDPVACAAFAVRGETLLRYRANGQVRVAWFRAALEAYPRIHETHAFQKYEWLQEQARTARPDRLFGVLFAPNSAVALAGDISKREILLGLGESLSDTGHASEALVVLSAALKERVEDDRLVIDQGGTRRLEWKRIGTTVATRAMNSLGLASYRNRNYRVAHRWFLKGLAEARRRDDTYMEAVVLANMAMLKAELHDVDEAVTLHLRSLELVSSRSYWELMGNQFGNLGIIYSDLGAYGVALYWLKKARAIHEAHGNHLGIALTLGEIAVAQARAGEVAGARHVYAEALTVAADHGYHNSVTQLRAYEPILGPASAGAEWQWRHPLPTDRVTRRHANRRSTRRRTMWMAAICSGLALAGAAASYSATGAWRWVSAFGYATGCASAGMGLGWIVVRLFEYGLARCLSETVPKWGTGWCTRVLPWAHRLLPGRSRILHLYTTWLDWKGKNTAAIEVLTRRISIVIADYGLVCQLAWALADSGDLEQAELWLEQAKRMNPDNPCLFDTEAWIEFRKEHYQAAYAKLAEALPFAPHSPDISYHAGAVLSRLNRREEAIAYLRMALEFVRPFGGRESATALLAGLTARNPST